MKYFTETCFEQGRINYSNAGLSTELRGVEEKYKIIDTGVAVW